MILKSPLYLSLFAFVIINVAILYYKPRIFFYDDKLRQTGCGGNNKIILSYPMFTVLSSILIYFIFAFLM